MRVKDIMMGPVVTVSSRATLAAAIDVMTEHHVTGVPVVDETRQLCGVLSEGDLLRRIELGTEAEPKGWWSVFTGAPDPAEAYRRENGRVVAEVMSPLPVTVDTETSLVEAAEIMEKNRFRRLPVLHHGELVGMITRTDFVRALRGFVAPRVGGHVSDNEIKQRIRATLLQQQWAASCTIDVSVVAGRVTLEGAVPNDDRRRAARVAAENVDGVTSVDERLKLFEPVVVPGF